MVGPRRRPARKGHRRPEPRQCGRPGPDGRGLADERPAEVLQRADGVDGRGFHQLPPHLAPRKLERCLNEAELYQETDKEVPEQKVASFLASRALLALPWHSILQKVADDELAMDSRRNLQHHPRYVVKAEDQRSIRVTFIRALQTGHAGKETQDVQHPPSDDKGLLLVLGRDCLVAFGLRRAADFQDGRNAKHHRAERDHSDAPSQRAAEAARRRWTGTSCHTTRQRCVPRAACARGPDFCHGPLAAAAPAAALRSAAWPSGPCGWKKKEA
mmetsp:Transcript_71656/g.186376  ORF Transcript_71656/g.186376 Transcript_71656/m.186376 type:complete len:272 (-) Transcript_71656:3-818(-)